MHGGRIALFQRINEALRCSGSVSSVSSIMFDSLQAHGLQHAWLPCPSPAPRACINACASSWWCHPTMSSSVTPFSSCLQSFPASGSFPMSQFFASLGQSIGVSASASVLPMNIQGWSPLGWTGLISLQSKGLSRVFSSTTIQKHQFFSNKPYLWSNSHICTTRNYFVPLFPSHALTNGQKPEAQRGDVSKLTEFSHDCESSAPHIKQPSLRFWQRDLEFPGHLTLKGSEIWS